MQLKQKAPQKCNAQQVCGTKTKLIPQQEWNLWPFVNQSDALTTELEETHGRPGHKLGFMCDMHPAYC